ncbi:MAG: HNH/ENDO VII family nuclease [Dysosmobacter sp.]
MEQYEVYKNAGLHEAEINGRKCLIKDIDMDYVDPKTGLTNRELMEKGRPPIDAKTGETIQLHHMGQDFNSPFAELCANSEHGDGKDAILHDKKAESRRQDTEKKNKYNNVQRPNHWKARAKEI